MLCLVLCVSIVFVVLLVIMFHSMCILCLVLCVLLDFVMLLIFVLLCCY